MVFMLSHQNSSEKEKPAAGAKTEKPLAKKVKRGEKTQEAHDAQFEEAERHFGSSFDEDKVSKDEHKRVYDLMGVVFSGVEFKTRNKALNDITIGVGDVYVAAYRYVELPKYRF
jgi:hypothetical protein